MEKLSITELIEKVHENAKEKGFHEDYKIIKQLYTNGKLEHDQFILLRNVVINSKLALITTEVAECTEELRKNHLLSLSEELADIVIRCLDLAGLLDIDLETEIELKISKNEDRPYLHNKLF